MGENKNIPELRFPEYISNWKTKSIGTLGVFWGGGTPESSKKEYWEGNIPWISSSDILENNIHDIQITRYINEDAIRNSATKKIPKGSVLMVSRVGIGKFAVAPTELCTSQDFTSLVTNENSYFLGYYFSIKANRFVRLSQGTSIKGFTGKDIKNAKFHIPELPEQTKIADFLTTVDERINLLAQQKEKLEQYKNGLMQQIFSQKLRFKDEDGNAYPEWKEKRLGEIGRSIGGGTPQSSKSEFWTGTIPWISSSDINENDVHYINITRHITEEALHQSATKIIPRNSILVVSRVGIGKFAVTCCDLCTSQDFTSIILKDERNSPYFFAYYFLTKKNEFKRLAQGTSIKGFTSDDMKNMKFLIPSVREQQKIASFLSSTDNKIELVTQQIEQTKLWKKGLLQKMFV